MLEVLKWEIIMSGGRGLLNSVQTLGSRLQNGIMSRDTWYMTRELHYNYKILALRSAN